MAAKKGYTQKFAQNLADREDPLPEPTKRVSDGDEKGKPSAAEYDALIDELDGMAARVKSLRYKIGQALIPGAGQARMRQDIVDWCSWIGDSQLGDNGLAAWLREVKDSPDPAAELAGALEAAERRAADAEAALEALGSAGHPVEVTTGQEGALATAKTTAVVAPDESDAIVYDDEDEPAAK